MATKGRPITKGRCVVCGRALYACGCPHKVRKTINGKRQWIWIDPVAAPTAPDSPSPPTPDAAQAPAPAPAAPPPKGNGAGAFAALAVGDAALKVDPLGAVPGVYQAPAAPSAPPAPSCSPTQTAPVNPGAIAAAVSAAAGSTGQELVKAAEAHERVALTVEEQAQLRAIAVTACQGIFFLNNWAMGKYYYRMDVLDMPPPVPAHVQMGADLLQPAITKMIGTHTTLGAVLAFGAVLGQHNVALARSIAKTRATAVKQTAETDELAGAKSKLQDTGAPPPSPPPPPPVPSTAAPPRAVPTGGNPIGVDGAALQPVVPEIRRPAR